MAKYYVGQVVEIALDTHLDDLSAATTPTIRAMAPDGVVKEWPATVNGSKLVYTTAQAAGETPADLHCAGRWRLQALPNIPGAEAPGETVNLIVTPLGQ
ncbi:MAG: hypothetical protein AB7E55_00930 [Pigmentiphaga sp.]